jgi:hypothetical protein
VLLLVPPVYVARWAGSRALTRVALRMGRGTASNLSGAFLRARFGHDLDKCGELYLDVSSRLVGVEIGCV